MTRRGLLHRNTRLRKAGTFLLLVGACCALIQTSQGSNRWLAEIRALSQTATLPLWRAGAACAAAWHQVEDRSVSLWAGAGRTERLEAILDEYEAKLACLEYLEFENAELRAALALPSPTERGVTAEVIGSDPSAWSRSLLVNRGAENGVVKDAAVLCQEGVVGRVLEVGSRWSRVQLITDSLAGVHVRLVASASRGILHGTGDGLCAMTLINPRDKCALDELMVTTGYEGIYPPGKIAGRVKAVTVENTGRVCQIVAQPGAPMTRLAKVLILTREEVPSAPVISDQG